MPAWDKFLKDIISHKSKLEDYGLVSLVEEFEESKAMYSKSLPKLKDPGSKLFYSSLFNWWYSF